MDFHIALERRARAEEFLRSHRIGLLTMLFTDMVGSTELKRTLGEVEAIALIQRHHALVQEVLGQFKEAEEIGRAGDSFFLVFAKPSEAVKFALLLQARLRAFAKQSPQPLSDRIGIHVGEVFIQNVQDPGEEKNLYGSQVDLCSRIASLGQADQILMTRFVLENAQPVLKGQEIPSLGPLVWVEHGQYLLKGISNPVEICEVGEEGSAALSPPKAPRHGSPETAALRMDLVEELDRYYTHVIESLDRTPWFRQGVCIRATAISVPARVFKESTRSETPNLALANQSRRDFGNAASRQGGEPAHDAVDPEVAALYEEPADRDRREAVPWQKERIGLRRAMILGAPGGGKSFLTNTTAIEVARSARDTLRTGRAKLDTLELPIHLTLARLADPALPRDPAEALLSVLQRDLNLSPPFTAWLASRLRQANTWLVFDALDEVREDERPALTERLRVIETQGWHARVLLTCRPANWSRQLIPWIELTEYELAPFSQPEIHEFIGRWFTSSNSRGTTLREVLDRNFSLNHAARTPLLTTFLCLAHEEAPLTAATRRVDLYARVMRGLARRAWKEKPLALANPHVDELVRFLVSIAQPLFELHPPGNLFTFGEITRVMKEAQHRPLAWVLKQQIQSGSGHPLDISASPSLLRDELLETGILVGAGLRDGTQTQYALAHRTLLEYLAARALSEQAKAGGWPSIKGLVNRKSWDPAWRETMLFLAGELDEPAPLLALLTDATTDDATRQRLCLSGHCLPEIGGTALAALQKRSPNHVANPRRIARQILELWWENLDRFWGSEFMAFQCLSNALPALAAACRDELVPELLNRAEAGGDARAKVALAFAWLGNAGSDETILAWLLERLRDSDPRASALATWSLARLGGTVATQPLLARLLDLLANGEAAVRERAVKVLGALGPAAATETVVAKLLNSLDDPDRRVRACAAEALGCSGDGATADTVLSRLMDCLGDFDLSRPVLNALERMGPAAATKGVMDKLFQILTDPEWRLRAEATENACRLGSGVPSVPASSRWLAAAVEAVGLLGSPAATEAMLIALMNCLRDKDWVIRTVASTALSRLGRDAATPAVLDRLLELLRHADPDLREAAAKALGRLGSAAATDPVFDGLASALRDSHPNVRASAAEALGGLGTKTGPWTALLAEGFGDPDARVRAGTAEAFGRLGSAAATPTVFQKLLESLRDPQPEVQESAMRAFGRLGSAAATALVLERLTEWMDHEELKVQHKAIEALGQIGPAAATERVLIRLWEWLRDAPSLDDAIRENTLDRLRSLGANESDLENAGIRLSGSYPWGNVRIAEALGRLGPSVVSEVVLAWLQLSMRDALSPKPAAEAMARLGRAAAAAPVVEQLVDWLRNDEWWDKSASAAKVLESFLQAGVRWFPDGNGTFRITTVDELSA